MERKTNVTAEDGKQEITITREFDLPVNLVFKAYTEAGLLEQWMGTRVLKLESKKFGSYRFETAGPRGNVAMHGTIHEFITDQKITRTFEMEGTPFGVQLELLTFERLTDDTSKLTIHSVFESVAQRDALLKLPFAMGINMAHNRLQQILNQLK